MLNYDDLRNRFRPDKITTLLIGEAPPPNKTSFFYLPKELHLSKNIKNDTSLPATIFNHYFGRRPENIDQYKKFLLDLKDSGIFLIDIIDEPLKIRGNKENEAYLITQIPDLHKKIKLNNIETPEENWVFLLARSSYQKHIRLNYPRAKRFRWIEFRLSND